MRREGSTRVAPPVMILCGGLGTRLREETEVRPKPMVEIGGRPILWHIMKLYACHGLTDFILCLGYKGYLIKQYFLDYKSHQSDFTLRLGAPETIEFHRRSDGDAGEEDWRVTLAETGQASQTGARVARAGRYVRGSMFCVTYGDGVGNVDVTALLAFHRKHGRLATITGMRPPGRFGEIRLDAKGRAIEFNEKPQVTEGVINGGFFVFQREVLERYVSDDGDVVLEQAPLQRLAHDGELMVYMHEGFWQPMDTYRELVLLDQLWRSGKAPWKVWA